MANFFNSINFFPSSSGPSYEQTSVSFSSPKTTVMSSIDTINAGATSTIELGTLNLSETATYADTSPSNFNPSLYSINIIYVGNLTTNDSNTIYQELNVLIKSEFSNPSFPILSNQFFKEEFLVSKRTSNSPDRSASFPVMRNMTPADFNVFTEFNNVNNTKDLVIKVQFTNPYNNIARRLVSKLLINSM